MIIDLNTFITLLPSGEGARRADEGLSAGDGANVFYDRASRKALIKIFSKKMFSRFAPPSPDGRRATSYYGVGGQKP